MLSALAAALLAESSRAEAPPSSPPPLLLEATVAALAAELDGDRAHRHVEWFALHHRMRGSRPFRAASDHVLEELKTGGYANAEVLRFPADGKTMFGTQKSRLAWDAEFAELWLLEQNGSTWTRREKIADYASTPLSLAQDSDAAQVSAELVDAGAGTSESDYAGKDVRGKLVLTSSQPSEARGLALERFGAAGIVSYAQNQKTAWWREDEALIRWGHLGSFAPKNAFAFMISLGRARALQARLAAGDTVRLEAVVRASRHPGEYRIVTATLPGSDPALAQQEVVFSCHLDHPRPGANDNASGCATILEVARAFSKLIREGRLRRPRRTMRFLWPPEIEGTTILLNARPDLMRNIRAVVHLDMVGGGPQTKAVFHVTRAPLSLPSFVNDVAEAFAEFVNRESEAFAAGRAARYPLIAPGGGREALLAQMKEFDAGSDHVVYADSSFKIPVIYLNDWPDRYIHTTGDVPANIDATKLERAGFIAAASAWYLANLSAGDLPELLGLLGRRSLSRTATLLERRAASDSVGQRALDDLHRAYEAEIVPSIGRFMRVGSDTLAQRARFLDQLVGLVGSPPAALAPAQPGAEVVYRRCPDPKGPMSVFGYDYLEDHLGKGRAGTLALLAHQGLRGGGEEYALEVLNFVDGARSVGTIHGRVYAEFGPVPFGHVASYLAALAEIGVVSKDALGCSRKSPR